jgi:putative ABC transport system permease protein
MLLPQIKTAIRRLFRLKSHTVIGLAGLAIGLTSVIVIAAWAIQELSYDRFHKDPDLIFMATTKMKTNDGSTITIAETPSALANELKSSIPGIEQSCHFTFLYGKRVLAYRNNKFEKIGVAADQKMLELLNFPLLKGNVVDLNRPNSILLTEELAGNLFGDEDALEKNIVYQDILLTVKGIIKNLPENSSLKFDFIVSYQTEAGKDLTWSQFSDATFIRIAQKSDFEKIDLLAHDLWTKNVKYDLFSLSFLPITDFRYNRTFDAFGAEHGNKLKLHSFMGIALLILILASLNYANLITAQSVKRTSEINIKKINGAGFKNILQQFLVESALNLLATVAVAIIFSAVFLRLIQYLLDIHISRHYLAMAFILGSLFLAMIVGLISGLYPAVITSLRTPTFSGQRTTTNFRQGKIRNTFILSQFLLSISLTIVCLVIIRQTKYLNSYELGYNPKHIVQVYLPPEGAKHFETIRTNLLSLPDIKEVSFSRSSIVNLGTFFATDKWKWDGLSKDNATLVHELPIDFAYLDVYGITIVEGQNFSSSHNNLGQVIINEEFAKLLGKSNTVGKILRKGENSFEIIGVVQNFHFQSLSNIVQPLVFTRSDSQNRMYIKVSSNFNGAFGEIENIYNQFFKVPISYSFAEDELSKLYENEHKISIGILVFSIISILLSCIGLIGMVSFHNEFKMKEIGVRKVCGANIFEIVILLNKQIFRWFTLSFVLSCVISWYLSSRWLENFAYKAPLSWWVFLSGGMIVLIIVVASITHMSIKAAKTNPVISLKYE